MDAVGFASKRLAGLKERGLKERGLWGGVDGERSSGRDGERERESGEENSEEPRPGGASSS